MKLNILFTNDLHCRYEKIAKISKGIKDILKNYDKNDYNFIFDSGDFCDDLRFISTSTCGMGIFKIMNLIPYDAITLGNHDVFSYGLECVKKMSEVSNVPLLGANIMDENESYGIRSNMLVENNNLKVGIIGISFDYDYTIIGGKKSDINLVIEENIKILKNKNANIIILLSHLGLEKDKEVAKKHKNIDIIIGGHDHKRLTEILVEGNAYIVATEGYGKSFGELNIKLDNKIKNIKEVVYTIHEVSDNLEDDTFVVKNITRICSEIENKFSNVIGYTSKPLYVQNIGKILVDYLKKKYDTDISLMNTGFILKGLEVGEIKEIDTWNILPLPLQPVIFEMRGKELKSAIFKMLNKDFENNLVTSDGIRFGKLIYSGISIDNNMQILTSKKEHIEDEEIYKIIANDYIALGGNDLLEIKSSQVKEILNIYLREIFIEIIVKDFHKLRW